MEIIVSEDKVSHLSKQAKDEFSDSIQTYAEELIEEANRLEASTRVNGGKPEITRAIIKDAELYLKKYSLHSKPKSWGYTLLQIFSVLSILFTGGLFNIEKFKTDTVYLVIFLVILTVAIGTNVATIIFGRFK